MPGKPPDAAAPAGTPPAGRGPGEGRILFFPEPCVRPGGTACARCETACPARAISFDGPQATPRIDDAACTRCGICIGICDCFGSSLVTTYDFAKRLERIAREHGDVVLCCGEDVFEGLDPAGNVVVLNCLSSLPPELIAYLLASDAKVVLAHDLAYCEGCAVGGAIGGRLWQRSFELAQEWTGRAIASADEIPEKEDIAGQLAAPSRRGLFTNAVAAAADVASGRYRERKSTAVDDFLARRDRMRAATQALPAGTLYLDDDSRDSSRDSRLARRRLMREAVQADPSIAGRVPGG